MDAYSVIFVKHTLEFSSNFETKYFGNNATMKVSNVRIVNTVYRRGPRSCPHACASEIPVCTGVMMR